MLHRKVLRLTFILSVVSLCVGSAFAANQKLHGHITAAAVHAKLLHSLSTTTTLNLQIGLPLKNQDALKTLLEQLYDPTSPEYHQYLNPEQFAERFGPTEQDYQKVMEFFTANGFTITGTHSNRIVLDISGSVDAIQKTFHVNMGVYQYPTEARTFYAPDVAAMVSGLSVPILDVAGLDNFAPPRPMNLKKIPLNQVKANTTGSGPNGLFAGNDFRAAYAPGVSLNGSGQTVGLFEFGPYYSNDITTYENQFGLPHVPITNVLLDGVSGVPTSSDDTGEESLDIEMDVCMAPGASRLMVYEGNNPDDILSRIATDNQAKQISLLVWLASI